MSRSIRLAILIGSIAHTIGMAVTVPDLFQTDTGLPEDQITEPAVKESLDESSITKYIPLPELSPSTREIRYENMVPGESRTLFMDFANVGIGLITIDKVEVYGAPIAVSLPQGTLRPGEFVRFPVTLIQPDLQVQEYPLVFLWSVQSLRYVDSLEVTVFSSPWEPLVITPSPVDFGRRYLGSGNTVQLMLENPGPVPVEFPGTVEGIRGFTPSPLPEVLGPVGRMPIELTWLPLSPGEVDTVISIPYRVADVPLRLDLVIRGMAEIPVSFETDTLGFGAIYAGGTYGKEVSVINRSSIPVRLRKGEIFDRATAREADEWIEVPDDLLIPPGDTIIFPVRIGPHTEGRINIAVNFGLMLKRPGVGWGFSQGEITLILAGNIGLPIHVHPDSVSFAGVPVFEVSSRDLRVVNAGKVPLRLQPRRRRQIKGFAHPSFSTRISADDSLRFPVVFTPDSMQLYADTLVLSYRTFSKLQEVVIPLSGKGLDQPLLRIDTIPDIHYYEDQAAGGIGIADLRKIFVDRNHRVGYTVSHTLGNWVDLDIRDGSILNLTTTPNFHGTGQVIVQCINQIGHLVADTFLVAITAVNDYPVVRNPLRDVVVKEDAPPVNVGNLKEIFTDPDSEWGRVTTIYRIIGEVDEFVQARIIRGDIILDVAPNWNGARRFVVTATDPLDTSVVVFDEFKLLVIPVNDPPDVNLLPDFILNEDETARLPWTTYVRDIDNELSELRLIFSKVGGGYLPISFEEVTPELIVLRPDPDWWGNVDIILTASDLEGASGADTFTVQVMPINDMPAFFKAKGPFITDWDERLKFSGDDTLITFHWQAASDPDPEDRLQYTWLLLDTTGQIILNTRPAADATSVTAQFDSSGIYRWTVVARDTEGHEVTSDTLILILESLSVKGRSDEEEISFRFGPNYPNPFSGVTRIEYALPNYSMVVITIYDAMGKKVRTLLSEPQFRGRYSVTWEGKNDQGQQVSSGPYVAQMKAGTFVAFLTLTIVH